MRWLCQKQYEFSLGNAPAAHCPFRTPEDGTNACEIMESDRGGSCFACEVENHHGGVILYPLIIA